MNGIELSRAFFERHGLPMLERDFPELLPFLAELAGVALWMAAFLLFARADRRRNPAQGS